MIVDYNSIFKKDFIKFINQNKYLSVEDFDLFLKKYTNFLNPKYIVQLNAEKNKYLNQHNKLYLNNYINKHRDYFNNMFKNSDIKLDDDQIMAVIINDNMLILAGEGSGKTTTMAAKVKYLIDTGYKEEELLVISFTNFACNEIRKVIQDELGCYNVKVTTFHSLGLDLIKKSGKNINKIIDEDSGKYKIISNFIKNVAFNDKQYLYKLIIYFDKYFNLDKDIVMKYNNFNEFHKNSYLNKLKKSNLDLKEYNDIQIKNRKKRKKTIKGEFLRSQQEVDIANFLFLNGIEYKYEYKFIDNKEQDMHSDFTINQNGLENIIEHIGLDEQMQNNLFSEEEKRTYINNLKAKQKYINEANLSDKFIFTWSKYLNSNNTYSTELEKILIEKGYKLNKKTDKEVFEALMISDTEGYFYKFIYEIVIKFISIYKRNNYTEKDLKYIASKTNKDIGKQLFLLKRIFDYYQEELEKSHNIDFDDMINLSSKIIPTLREKDLGVDYKYLIIDEYQDISMQRYDLTSLLAKLFDAKIMAVGDDWQTIFSFAGADVELTRKFAKYLKNAKTLPIRNTYRNSQELIDIASKL